MPSPRAAFEFTPRRSPRMVLVVLTLSEVLMAMKTAGADATDGDVRRELLRYALRAVGEEMVSYPALQGDDFGGFLPRTRHRLTGIRAFNRLHEPSADEQERLRDSLSIVETADAEQYVARLPNGRTITLTEIAERTVEQAMADARRESSSGAFAGLHTLIGTLRNAIVSIDGTAVTPDQLSGRGWEQHFSVRETLLLGSVLSEMQDDDFGEGAGRPLERASGSSGT